jgi:hypothetical protein
MLRAAYRHGAQEVTGEWRKVHNEELHDAYYSPDINRHKVKAKINRRDM